MAIKEVPTNIRSYYRLFMEHSEQKLSDAYKLEEELIKDIKEKHDTVSSWKELYSKEFNFDLDSYDEFKNNTYLTGKFLRAAKGLFINKQNEYELVHDAFYIYDLASKQKELYDCRKSIEFYKKCSSINFKIYSNILRTYYVEIHKKLIIEGKGYSFSNNIGWICVNRCTFDKKRPMLDYAATKKREKELKDRGERIYNKEEADWCTRNGIEYNGKDKRVFVCKEYCYQIPLIDSKLPNYRLFEFKISDYRGVELRGKTNKDIIALCNNDINKICELSLDLKTKLTLCDEVDKTLYVKFIRNEAQKPITFRTTARKD